MNGKFFPLLDRGFDAIAPGEGVQPEDVDSDWARLVQLRGRVKVPMGLRDYSETAVLEYMDNTPPLSVRQIRANRGKNKRRSKQEDARFLREIERLEELGRPPSWSDFTGVVGGLTLGQPADTEEVRPYTEEEISLLDQRVQIAPHCTVNGLSAVKLGLKAIS